MEGNGHEVDPGDTLTKDFRVPCQVDPMSIPLNAKLHLCAGYKDKLHALDTHIVNTTFNYKWVNTRELFINRNKCLFQDLSRVEFLLFIIMRSGSQSVMLHTGNASQGVFEKVSVPDERIKRLV